MKIFCHFLENVVFDKKMLHYSKLRTHHTIFEYLLYKELKDTFFPKSFR